jgi:hypothetical protein
MNPSQHQRVGVDLGVIFIAASTIIRPIFVVKRAVGDAIDIYSSSLASAVSTGISM